MTNIVWWTGAIVWVGISSLAAWVLWVLLLSTFNATWFTTRCVREGGTKSTTPINIFRIWKAGFLGHIHSVRAADGHYIVYPGYGRSDEESKKECRRLG